MPSRDRMWRGRGVTNARQYMAQYLPAPCARCGSLITPGTAWVVGHKEPRALRPDLVWETSNWQVEHRTCSDRSGAEVMTPARMAQRERGWNNRRKIPNGKMVPGFSGGVGVSQGPASALSLPDPAPHRPELDGNGPNLPEPSPGWQGVEWASDLVNLWESDDAFTWPRLLTEPNPDAVGTYGWRAVDWIHTRRAEDSRVPANQKRLRGFQVLRLVAGLQHDDAGHLLVGTRLESTPRQQGKSVGLSEETLWRIHAADLFGEEQLVMHTAKDLAVAREVQRSARLWAADRGMTVRGTHGQEEIEHGDGSRWLIRGRDSVYSYSAGFAIVDEAWGVDPSVVDDGMEPTLVERESGQLLLISTAHRRASSLFPERRRGAIRGLSLPGGRSALAEWSAPPDADVMDPAVWRIATAHWTPRRAAFLTDKVGRPGWREQWLNVWPSALDDAPADVWLSRSQMAVGVQKGVNPPAGTVAQVAVEVSDTHRVWAVAASWVAADGRVVVTTDGGPGGVESALVVARAWVERWPGGNLYAHLSITSRVPPGFPAMVVNMKQSDASSATALLRDLVLEGRLRHTGGHLLEQVEDVVVRTVDGRELVDQSKSRGPVPAVKAAAWSVWATTVLGSEVSAVY
jgi:hypothetical protein